MEEKKLTDEEIVNDIERSTGMPSYWKKIVLDLIYRLQDEKQKVVQDYYCEAQHCDVQKDIIEEQKAEIERLGRRNGEKIIKIDDLEVKVMDLEKQNAELQKQVDELKLELQGQFDKGVKAGCLMSKVKEKQAVKDNAKEILNKVAYVYTEDMGYIDWLKDCYFGGEMERLCEKYGLKAIQTKKGVEVE